MKLHELVEKADKVEQRLKRRDQRRSNFNYTTPISRPFNPKGETKIPATSPSQKSRFEDRNNLKPAIRKFINSSKLEVQKPRERVRDDRCFKCQGRGHIANQCPNQRTMITLTNGEIVTDNAAKYEGMPPLMEDNEESPDENELAVPDGNFGTLKVVQPTLSTRVKEKDELQCENIIYTRYFIKEALCSVIIDSGSCTSVASATMVENLKLTTQDHPRPYKLQWLNNSGEVRVTEQVLIFFHIGKYVDEILCDVVSMQASHIIFGRSWKFDRGVSFDGVTNKYSFIYNNKKITLAPLYPKQVHED